MKKITKILLTTSILTISAIVALVVPLSVISCSSSQTSQNNDEPSLPPNNNDPKPIPPTQPEPNKKINIEIVTSKEVNENEIIKIIPKISNVSADIENNFQYQWQFKNTNDNSYSNFPNQTQKDFNQKASIDLNGIKIRLEIRDQDNIFYSNECLIIVNPININDWENIGIEGIDYFYFPNTPKTVENRITLKTTKNQLIQKKWGTIPLPWKENITDVDLENMFSVITILLYNSPNRNVGIENSGNNTNQRGELYFANRNVDADLFATSYAKWIVKFWKVFPYFQMEKGAFSFIVKNNDICPPDQQLSAISPNFGGILKAWMGGKQNPYNEQQRSELGQKYVNEQTYYINDFVHTGTGQVPNTYFEEILSPSKERDSFNKYLLYLFSQIRPGMSDMDKFLAVSAFVSNWMDYGSGAWMYNMGVCADYANLLAMSLNFVGISAIPTLSNILKEAQPPQTHEVVWVYIDPNNYDPNTKGNRQWYMSDPTFYDSSFGSKLGITKPSSGWARNQFYTMSSDVQFNFLLGSTSQDQFNSAKSVQYTYSQLFYLPWKSPYINENVIGKANTGNFNIYHNKDELPEYKNSFMFLDRFNNTQNIIVPDFKPSNWTQSRTYSRYIFNNGYYYWIATTTKDKQNFDTNMLLRAKAGSTDKGIELVNVPSEYQFLLNDHNQYGPILQQWNNWTIFLNRTSKKLYLFQFDDNGINWTTKYEVYLGNDPDLERTIDFYIDLEGNLNYLVAKDFLDPYDAYKSKGWYDSSTLSKSINLNQIDANFSKILFGYNIALFNQYKVSSDDVKNAYEYFFIIGGTNKIGNENNQVSLKKREKYYADIKAICNQANNNSNHNIDLINQMQQVYIKYNNSSIVTSNEPLIISQLLNTKYYISQPIYNQYGFNDFNIFKGYDNFNQMLNSISNLPIKYDVYFKPSINENDPQPSITELVVDENKIISNSYSPNLNAKILKNPYGWYVIKIYNPNNKENYTLSNITKICNSDEEEYPSGKLKVKYINNPNGSKSDRTNYNNESNSWFNESIVLYRDWNISYINPYNVSLKYINIDNPNNINIISTDKNQKQFEIGKINNSNHGIYYYQVDLIDKNISLFTNFIFLATKEDVDNNFSTKKWVDAIKTINLIKTYVSLHNNFCYEQKCK